MERACQAKAQEVCQQLTNDYEAKVAGVSVYNYVNSGKSIIHLQNICLKSEQPLLSNAVSVQN